MIDAPAVALTAGTARSVLVASAPSTQAFRVVQFDVGCDAVATGWLKVEFLVGTLTAGTTSTAPNVGRMNGEGYNKTPLTTATAYSVEPTYTKHASNSALVIRTLPPIVLPSGPAIVQYPLGREFYCPPSNVLAVRLTATTVSPNSYTNLIIEE